MGRNKKFVICSDFETTVTGEKEQDYTEVWSAASCEVLQNPTDEDVVIQGSIQDYFKWLESLKRNCKVFFHNEKFDGSFIVDYLLRNDYKLSKKVLQKDELIKKGYVLDDENISEMEIMTHSNKEMQPKSFNTLISDKGIWYSIKVKFSTGYVVEFVDSLKLMPLSLKAIGKSFNTPHKKLDMNYVGNRYANCSISDEELKYIRNDVLVLSEALYIMMYENGHEKMTIGACALSEFSKKYDRLKFNDLFPKLYGDNYRLPKKSFGYDSAGEYVRASYRGGWCFVKPDRKSIVFKADKEYKGKMIAGTCADVNSLYPSMMISKENRYPVGKPHFSKDKSEFDKIKNDSDKFYYVRLKTRFYLKDRKLPCLQVKPSEANKAIVYPPREWLYDSDFHDKKGNSFKYVIDDIHQNRKLQMIPELVLSKVDLELVEECYDLEDTEFLDFCWFYTKSGYEIFGEYIEKYAEIKKNSKGALRQIAKLFLNSLYGKFSTSCISDFQEPYLDEEGDVHFKTIRVYDANRGAYIPIGAAITSYARAFTIRAAIANYDTFCYADTDSIHCLCTPDEIKDAPEDPVEFSHWKYESCFDEAIYVRPKTYIEHNTFDTLEPIEKPYYNIKCAGMCDRSKTFFDILLNENVIIDNIEEIIEKYDIKNITDHEKQYLLDHKHYDISDFKIGLSLPGSLRPRRIKGGILLVSGEYVMRPNIFGA